MFSDSNLVINSGLYIPTSNVWDVTKLYEVDVTKPEFKELLVRLYQNINNISIALNLKESAYYFPTEFVNGQAWYPNPALIDPEITSRPAFRMVVEFGTLPNTSTTSIPHNIDVTASFSFTRIYGTANDPVNGSYIPLPYSSASSVANNIELSVDSNNINITTGSDRSSYTTTYVILEYLKE